MNCTTSLPDDATPVNSQVVTLPIASNTHKNTDGAVVAERGEAAPATAALPCLKSNNCCIGNYPANG